MYLSNICGDNNLHNEEHESRKLLDDKKMNRDYLGEEWQSIYCRWDLRWKITTGSLRGLSSSTYLMTIMYKNEATMAIPIALFKHKFTQVSILC